MKAQNENNDIRQWLDTNEEIDHFGAMFQPKSWEGFKTYYIKQREVWAKHGKSVIRRKKKASEQHYTKAFECLWEIQQKKLFDLQCLWRAEKQQLPGIEISEDFMYWGEYIQECSFLTSITQAELELYREYLLSTVYEEDDPWPTWQNYDSIKDIYAGERDYGTVPAWYTFYDQHMGTGYLMDMPDIRGEKENRYLLAWNKAWLEANPQEERESLPYPTTYNKELLETFIKRFDPAVMSYYRAIELAPYRLETIEYELAYIYLTDMKETIAIEGGPDWRDQIIQARNTHFVAGVNEALDKAYKEYLRKLQKGLAFIDPEEKNERFADFCAIQRKHIKEGREILGEPGDLNF